MSWLAKLNPANSLFGRLFLWFWFAAILMVVCAVWVARQLTPATQIDSLNLRDRAQLQQVTREITTAVRQRPRVLSAERLLRGYSRQSRVPLIAYDIEAQSYIFALPPGVREQELPLDALVEQRQPLKLSTPFMVFLGPQPMQIKNAEYLLFVGKPRPGGPINNLRKSHPLVLIGVVLVISGVLCFFFAWSLVKPVREVQTTARAMAAGNLKARVGAASQRKDELGQLGQDFNHMADQVDTLLSGQKRLLADVSHELRSPLARLQLAIGIAQQQAEDMADTVAARQLERVETEAERIEQMLQRVLTLSKLEASTQSVQFQQADLAALCKSLVEDNDIEARQSGKQLKCQLPQQLVVEMDELLLASAIENILRNGVRYARTQVMVSLQRQQHEAVILIEDDGKGVEQSELEHIFTPFYRVSASRERETGGVGLGLAIAQNSVKQHQGTIKAMGASIGGLGVEIRIPLTRG